jgi:hypothetical protein
MGVRPTTLMFPLEAEVEVMIVEVEVDVAADVRPPVIEPLGPTIIELPEDIPAIPVTASRNRE